MSIMHLQLKQNQQEKHQFMATISGLEVQKQELSDSVEVWQQMFKFYQGQVLKLAKDLELLRDKPEVLKAIEKLKGDLSQQEELIRLL